MKITQYSAVFLAASMVATAGTASAAMSFEAPNGWEFSAGGYIPVFFVADDTDNASNEATITTGFNPASLNLGFTAPEQNGVTASGHFQLNNHVGVGGNNIDGLGSRVAKINLDGDFGTVSIGQGYGLFGTPAIGDRGSAMGVGVKSGQGSSLATLGRIGTGYFYADFHPRLSYFSNRSNGVQFAVTAVDPASVGDIESDTDVTTELPRFEARLDYAGEMMHVWTSGATQELDDVGANDDSATLTGIDVGGALDLGAGNLRANYSTTEGTGGVVFGNATVAQTVAEEGYDQWYVEGSYDFGIHTIGASYGEGEFDSAAEANELTMLFSRHRVTDALTFMIELQDYAASDVAPLASQGDYQAFIVGSQLNF